MNVQIPNWMTSAVGSYRLTDLGSKAANTETRRLASLVTVARRRGLAVAH